MVRLVLTTVPDAETATEIARALVEERLAACVNVVPGLTSIYRWEGEIQEDTEFLLLIKTTEEAIDALQKRLEELHPYSVPEVLAFQVNSGLERYLSWVEKSVK